MARWGPLLVSAGVVAGCGGGGDVRLATAEDARLAFERAGHPCRMNEESGALVRAVVSWECDGYSATFYESSADRKRARALYELIPYFLDARHEWVISGPEKDRVRQVADELEAQVRR